MLQLINGEREGKIVNYNNWPKPGLPRVQAMGSSRAKWATGSSPAVRCPSEEPPTSSSGTDFSVLAPSSPTSQGSRRSPGVKDHGGFPVDIFCPRRTNLHPAAAAPAAVITAAISVCRRAHVGFCTAALRQGFGKVLQHT